MASGDVDDAAEQWRRESGRKYASFHLRDAKQLLVGLAAGGQRSGCVCQVTRERLEEVMLWSCVLRAGSGSGPQ